jgi:hypothetical protein
MFVVFTGRVVIGLVKPSPKSKESEHTANHGTRSL